MKHPNIILIILDAVRARNLSAYGYPERTTPHIDAFAERHLLFERAFTTSTWTIPTHHSMLSGLYLSQHGLSSVETNVSFNENIVPLPAALREIGYVSAGFSQNLLFSPRFHFDSFDVFHTTVTPTSVAAANANFKKPGKRLTRLGMLRRYAHKAFSLSSFMESLEQWIRSRPAREPFFLAANIAQVHAPWAPPPGLLLRKLGRHIPRLTDPDFSAPKPFEINSKKKPVTDLHRLIWKRLYDSSLIHTDRVVGGFLRRLARWPGWQNTILILTADHGELLGDFNDIFGHTLTLNDRIMHVPLILKHPDYGQPGRVRGVVQTLDLYPTILGWNGYRQVPSAQLQRPTLDEALSAPGDEGGTAVAEEDYTRNYDVISGLRRVNPGMKLDLYPRQQTAYRNANFKLMMYDDRPSALYDMRADPDEAAAITAESPNGHLETIRRLAMELEIWRSNLEVFPPRIAGPNTDTQVDERLRDLGYLP